MQSFRKLLLGLLVCAGLLYHAPLWAKSLHPHWQPGSSSARRKLDVAERIMAHSRNYLPMDGDWEGHDTSKPWETALAPLHASLAIEPSGRGYRDLGMFYFLNGSYTEAIGPLTKALRISPSSQELRVRLEQARQAPRIEAWAGHHLPKKQEVGIVYPFPVKRRRLWVVFSTERREYHSENALISVFEERSHRLSLLWRSPVIKSIENREYFSADLWVFPMTGSKTPDLIFMGGCMGGSAEPTLMKIYHWTGRTFRQVLDTESEQQPLWIEDLHHTGRYQVRCVHLVGIDMSHGEQVRWADVYDWNGERFVEANAKYPEAFRQTKQEILTLLPKYPQDPLLLKYLARAYRQEGRRRLALVYLHRMERVCIELIKNDPDDIDSWWNLGESAAQTGHRARAVQCYGKAQRISRALAKKESDHDNRDYYLDFATEASRRITALHRAAK